MSNPIFHLIASAHALRPLVREDADRHDLLDALRAARGLDVLAYCVMDTHLHVVAEGAREGLVRSLAAALVVYTRRTNRRRAESGPLVKGEVVAIPVTDEEQLAKTIHYVHENPRDRRAARPFRQVDDPWSSARAFAGLARSRVVRVERARERLGAWTKRALASLGAPAPADLRPVRAPENPLELIVGAAASALGVPVAALVGPARAEEARTARAVAARLGRLEGFHVAQIGPRIGRGRSQACDLASDSAATDEAVRAARTLLRDPVLRRTLRRAAGGGPDADRTAHPGRGLLPGERPPDRMPHPLPRHGARETAGDAAALLSTPDAPRQSPSGVTRKLFSCVAGR